MTRDLVFEQLRDAGLHQQRVGDVQPAVAANAVEQVAGDRFVDLGFDQVGEHVEQRLRQVVLRRERRLAAELLDHRLQPIELPGDLVVEHGGRSCGMA